MIEAALVVVIFSLVPLLLDDLKLADQTLWRLASGLYLVGWACNFALTVWRGLRVLRRVQQRAEPSWSAVVLAFGVLSFASLLSGVSGFQSSSSYLFTLLLQLILCALFFYRYFLSLRRSVS